MTTRRDFLRRSAAAGTVVAAPQVLSAVSVPAYGSSGSAGPVPIDNFLDPQSGAGTLTGLSGVFGGSRQFLSSGTVTFVMTSGLLRMNLDPFASASANWPSSTGSFPQPLDLSACTSIQFGGSAGIQGGGSSLHLFDSAGNALTNGLSVAGGIFPLIHFQNAGVDLSDVRRIRLTTSTILNAKMLAVFGPMEGI